MTAQTTGMDGVAGTPRQNARKNAGDKALCFSATFPRLPGFSGMKTFLKVLLMAAILILAIKFSPVLFIAAFAGLIVAAVLGVVNTMGSVGQPPAVLGGMIGSALVGTFLGILLAYGFAAPLAGLLEQKIDEDGKELQCVKTTLLASMQGYAPQIAIEFGRKVLYSTERPTFAELESHVKKK